MRSLFLLFALFFFSIHNLFALDWIKLHNLANDKNFLELEQKIDLKTSSLDEIYLLGLVYLNAHKDDEAEKIFISILEKYPDTIEAKWGIAEVLRRKHKPKKAEKILENIIKENPDFVPAYITLAYIRYFQLNFNEAARLAYEVIRKGKNNSDLENLVRAYSMYAGAKGMLAHYGGPLSKAVNGLAVKLNLDKAEKLNPKSVAVLFGLGSYYLLAPEIAGGDIEKAEYYLKKAIEIDPFFTDVYVRLAQLYELKDDNDKYVLYINKAFQLDPENELFLDYKSKKCDFICPKVKKNLQ